MKQLLLPMLFFVTGYVNGQEEVKTFFNANGKLAEEASNIYYEIRKEGSDSVWTYYTKSNTIRSRAMEDAGGQIHGQSVNYRENGKVEVKGNYEHGRALGLFSYWYFDGKPNRVVQFMPVSEIDRYPFGFKIINYWNSMGAQLVKNGRGVCSCYFGFDEAGVPLREDGKVKDGARDSVWFGVIHDKPVFVEMYERGKLIEGFRYLPGGGESSYNGFSTGAEFDGGIPAFSAFISKNLRYPAKEAKDNVEGAVYIKFKVAEDGTLKDVVVVKGVSPALDDEALRVMKLSPRWIPAKERGTPHESDFVMPIKFKAR